MKLRNKRTGEVKDFALVVANSGVGDTTLAELNEEWEDVPEEPKKYYYITSCGEITHRGYRLWENESIHDKKRKEIGNYFETEEEAEKAVEKLKALTEAKENGLKIKGYYYNHEDLVILADIGKCNKLTLDTLFGKEID